MPLRIAAAYTVLGVAWIALSDRLAMWTAGGSLPVVEFVSTSKGVIYVLVTGLLLHQLLTRWERSTEAAHRAATAADHEFRRLFQDAPLPAFVFSREGLRVLEVNEAAIRRYGYTREEFLRLTAHDLRDPRDVGRMERAVALLDQQAEGLEGLGEWTHRTRRGEPVYVSLTWRNVVYGGQPARVVLANDLTEQRQAERTLAESEQTFVQMLGALNEAIWVSDPAFTRFYFVSAASEAICGLPTAAFENDTDPDTHGVLTAHD